MKITHRTPGARGRLHGVEFKNGIGYSDDPAILDRLRAAGHHVEDEARSEIGDLVDYAIENDIRPAAVDDLSDVTPLEVDPWTAPQA